jgi:hypothetical protein
MTESKSIESLKSVCRHMCFEAKADLPKFIYLWLLQDLSSINFCAAIGENRMPKINQLLTYFKLGRAK